MCSMTNLTVVYRRAANREPLLLHPGEGGRPETHLVGISAGLWNAVAVPIATNFTTLYDSSIEAGRVWIRLCRIIFARSRAREDSSGVWGRAVLGIAADKLENVLEQFQSSMVSITPQVGLSDSQSCSTYLI